MGKYDDYTREELIQRLISVEQLKNELLRHQQEEDRLEFAWSGNLGHWFWNYPKNQITFNPLRMEVLGYKRSELPEYVGFDFFTEKMHPDDAEFVTEQLKEHLAGKIPVWEVKYRIQAKDGSWRVYYDRGKVTQKDKEGNPLFLSGILFDVTEDEAEKQQLIAQNQEWVDREKTDGLTLLSNHSNIMYILAKYAKKSRDENKPLSVILLDIDHLKQQNELYGPMLGDEILKRTGSMIRKTMRKGDAAGRYSGEKFLLALPDTSKEEAWNLAERIREGLQESSFTQPAAVTISGGIAEYTGMETISQLIQEAEKKLYQAKSAGRNQVQL